MEHLTKQQIILLALLVSFVSSIASGIVTVSLMDQSNTPTITQTVNRVIERTIEKVDSSSSTTPVTKETVIVKDDQAVIDAIAKASNATVRIYDQSDVNFLGLGLIISSSGKIVSTIQNISSNILTAHLDGGNKVNITFVSKNQSAGISIFQAEQDTDPKNARVYSAATLDDSDSIKLGQSIVLISGTKDPIVATGIISSISPKIETSVKDADFATSFILANLLGEIIEINSIPSNVLKTYATP